MFEKPVLITTPDQADRNLKLGRDIIKMLSMHPNERKPEMIEKIMRAIQLVLDTFADYPLDTQKAISKYAYFESFSSGRVVMRKNDRPLRFHIIITGRALLADMMRLPTGKEEIRWRGVISKGENFGDESKEQLSKSWKGQRSSSLRALTFRVEV